ncbi:hypothetical protein HANVADRAFT_51103 [Hanseniaspora valbyensis NRRL Y-1626]|uniref:Nucleolar protein Dnt1-like N-terminal domain-containing protein n=1 Tax=Hanseniaspora valbyensis NRRL Y-1626 TaxID=766949 RepID=A0A1B7TKC7_9ASCO|nr:hypothetical protein HANVADRAFT_51103 [Hanseniaspora valbyensis NRRL Y-1626]
MSYQQNQQHMSSSMFNGNISTATTNNDMIKLQIALVPPNCNPIYTYSNHNMMMMMMSAMNPYAAMMNPYAAMMQQQTTQGFPMMPQSMPFQMFNTFPQQGHQQQLKPQQQQQMLTQDSSNNSGIFQQQQIPPQQSNNTIEFNPKVLTFNVFIDPSKTILQLAEAIYAKSSRLYPNLKKPIEILKIKDFEKNDLDVEELISENFSNASRKTVLCIVRNPLDFNRNRNYRFSYIPSEIENGASDAEEGGEENEEEGDNDMNFDNSDLYTVDNGNNVQSNNSRVTSMTQLQLSRKRNVSLLYQNKQKIPSLIIQKKRKSMLFNGDTPAEISSSNGQPEESVLPPPVERSPQMRISSNIGETRKRIFSSNLGQSNDAVSRSEEVDPDKRKTLDMVFAEADNSILPNETPSKEVTVNSNGQNPPRVNLYDATPNRFISRIVSASNTVIKSQPIPNMISSVQIHTMSPQNRKNSNGVANGNVPTSPTVHGKLDSRGAGEPILQSPGNGILPPRAYRIPIKQGLDVEMESSSSSSEEEEENKNEQLVEEGEENEDVDVEDESDHTVEKIDGLGPAGDFTPLNTKSAALLKVTEESPIRTGESNKSLLEMAKLPNETSDKKAEGSGNDNDDMQVENNSVLLKPIEENNNSVSTAPTENARAKRKAALAAAGRMDTKSVRVTDANGKEVLVPYNKVNSFMKNNHSNNLFDTLSTRSEGLKAVNSPIGTETKQQQGINRSNTNSPSPVKTQNKNNTNEKEKDQDEDKMDVESESSGTESDSSSGESSNTDSDTESEEEEESKQNSQKPRKVVIDTSNPSQRVPSARQQQQQNQNQKKKNDLKPISNPEKPTTETEKPIEKLSTLQKMRMHNKAKSLGSLSDLVARGIPPVHDKAAEKRLLLEKKRKEAEQQDAEKSENTESKSSSSSSSSDTVSGSDSSDDSDSDSYSDDDEKDKSKPKFIKKPKKKSTNAFASLVKDSKKI